MTLAALRGPRYDVYYILGHLYVRHPPTNQVASNWASCQELECDEAKRTWMTLAALRGPRYDVYYILGHLYVRHPPTNQVASNWASCQELECDDEFEISSFACLSESVLLRTNILVLFNDSSFVLISSMAVCSNECCVVLLLCYLNIDLIQEIAE